jgi:hypothetical protein
MNIMQVPHLEIGRLWMLYLTFICPVITIWQSYFNGQVAAKRARDHLFFRPYHPVASFKLSCSLSFHTIWLLNIKIGISCWQQIATWLLNYHSVWFQAYHMLLNCLALASQSGYSEGMHGQYTADSHLPAGIDFHTFFEIMQVSGVWHELIGFSPISQPTLLETMSIFHHILARHHIFSCLEWKAT